MLFGCLRIVAGGGKGAKCRFDCDGYRPDTLGGGIGLLPSRRYGNPKAQSEFILWSQLTVEAVCPSCHSIDTPHSARGAVYGVGLK